ncbi:MAG: terminase small subunit protein [Mesorhizobium sp.]|uniref:terminase small subunit-like protein n=1 Tax=unclassified Mesorhizobium TaxID=325217 RepID=UPI000FCCBC54|nr:MULTISPECIES: terminase small subunit protein [unclassified Mesorhizobium]RUV41081.1 terminase small subunit protein [Mesorhizobium sp. M1A.T.Ca.IN.004.03.1.1]RWG23321.1 MAG: terminase small subunit protein [Mesorhizobium sp.]RWG60481.1 MAG: terminase small subunit protein [Mesorhizobium sp.]RWH39480.1 MAG: terminase small subunit protein [Mesorhizobium sp.]RWK30825.1 MAG: terminase small subunit protein [Mesorhizobium sp.]
MARPTIYSDELANSICEQIAEGKSLRSICLDDEMPAKSTVFAWLADPGRDDFRTKYAHAREAQADVLVDEMTDIADDGSNDWMEQRNSDGTVTGWKENGEVLRRSALRISARQWIAEKLRPKKYGSKVALTDGDGGPLVVQVLKLSESNADNPASK